MEKIMTQPEKVEHILSRGCDYFGIKKEDLLRRAVRRSKYWDKKRMFVTILHHYTSCNQHEIAGELGYDTHSSVSYHLKQMDEELSDKVYGNAKTKMIYKELLAYIGYE